MSTVACDMV